MCFSACVSQIKSDGSYTQLHTHTHTRVGLCEGWIILRGDPGAEMSHGFLLTSSASCFPLHCVYVHIHGSCDIFCLQPQKRPSARLLKQHLHQAACVCELVYGNLIKPCIYVRICTLLYINEMIIKVKGAASCENH